MSDFVYFMHALYAKFFHDYFFRCEHIGEYQKCIKTAEHEHVIFISNHALTFEAVLLNYFLLMHQAGIVNTLVYSEAFKVPLVREFFRSCQCRPVSVGTGAECLKKHHILLFPEGMDFIRGLGDPDSAPRFHTGFLHMARQFLSSNGRKTVKIVPIAHAGVERALKFWVIKNQFFLEKIIKPMANYPFWVIPKLPFLIPTKVVFNWGEPVRLKLDDIKSDKKIHQWSERFRGVVQDLRKSAISLRDEHKWALEHTP